MSSATLGRILDEVKRLTPEERRQLREALEREAGRAVAPPSAGAVNDRWEREQRWLGEHRDEYLGQWVALEGDPLLGIGAGSVVIGLFGTTEDFFDAIYQYPEGGSPTGWAAAAPF